MTISFRMPEAWRGRITDRNLVAWLHEYARQPYLLCSDPGPGDFKRSFRLSGDDAQLIQRLSADRVSAFARRLIAQRLNSAVRSTRLLPSSSARVPRASADNSIARRIEQKSPVRSTPVAVRPQVEKNRVGASPTALELPPILCQPRPENGYSPMFRNGQWPRGAATQQEQRAYEEWLADRMKQLQAKRHEWEMRVGAVCTCQL